MFADVLRKIIDSIFPPRADEVILREVHEEEFLGLLEPEIISHDGFSIVSLLPFIDKRVRAAVHEAKYHGSERAFALLGQALEEYLSQLSEEIDLRTMVLIPIPLGPLRRKTRGFNQVEE